MDVSVEQVTLRTYRAEDANTIRQIDADYQREVGIDAPARAIADLDDIDGVYMVDGGAFWVLESADGTITGYGGVLRIDDTTARLRRFRVRQEWRRRGLATLLLMEAERFCAERGFRRIVLGTTSLQQAAQQLYKRHSYVVQEQSPLSDRYPDVQKIDFSK